MASPKGRKGPSAGSGGSSGSNLDRSSSMAFAFFSRRHSSAYTAGGLRRSVSSVGYSRRHSSPISSAAEKAEKAEQAENGGGSLSDGDASPTSPTSARHLGSRSFRSLRWRLLARKVLGNVDESEESLDTGANAGTFFSILTLIFGTVLCSISRTICMAVVRKSSFSCQHSAGMPQGLKIWGAICNIGAKNLGGGGEK